MKCQVLFDQSVCVQTGGRGCEQIRGSPSIICLSVRTQLWRVAGLKLPQSPLDGRLVATLANTFCCVWNSSLLPFKAWWYVMFGFTLYCIVGLFETDLQNGRLHWGLCNGQWMISESAIDVLSSGKCGAILVKSVHLLLQSYLWYLGVLNNSMKCFLSFSFQVIISAHSVFFFFCTKPSLEKRGKAG